MFGFYESVGVKNTGGVWEFLFPSNSATCVVEELPTKAAAHTNEQPQQEQQQQPQEPPLQTPKRVEVVKEDDDIGVVEALSTLSPVLIDSNNTVTPPAEGVPIGKNKKVRTLAALLYPIASLQTRIRIEKAQEEKRNWLFSCCEQQQQEQL
jgi:hypothetical protein